MKYLSELTRAQFARLEEIGNNVQVEAHIVGWSAMQDGPIMRRKNDDRVVYHVIRQNGRLHKLGKTDWKPEYET